jgi:hypothetical protein
MEHWRQALSRDAVHNLWQHLGKQLGIEPPDLCTLTQRPQVEHQACAYQPLGFRSMTEHQRRL